MCGAGLQPGGATGKIPPHHAPLQRMNFGRPEAQTSGFSNVWWQARVVSLFAEHVVPMWFGNVALLCGGLGAVALDVRVVLARDGWVLARVDRVPRHPEWFAAIAGGARAGHSLLGTPLGPLGPLDGVGRIAVADPPRTAPAGRRVALAVELANLGAAAWPVAT